VKLGSNVLRAVLRDCVLTDIALPAVRAAMIALKLGHDGLIAATFPYISRS
jgi:hypothetical protein